jgi:hypothetical protein
MLFADIKREYQGPALFAEASFGPLEFVQREARFLGRPERDWPDMSEFVAHFGNVGFERAQRSLRLVLARSVELALER